MPPTFPHNIILIGFMGVGKSTIGRQLSQILKYAHVDTDQLISDQEGVSISDLFSQQGEAYFRSSELRVLKQIQANQIQHHIISTGGGIVTTPEVCTLLPTLGFVIWLDASLESILKRTDSCKQRPLLQGNNKEEIIDSLLKQRNPLYRSSSHLCINTDQLTPHEITTGIIESASYHFGHHE